LTLNRIGADVVLRLADVKVIDVVLGVSVEKAVPTTNSIAAMSEMVLTIIPFCLLNGRTPGLLKSRRISGKIASNTIPGTPGTLFSYDSVWNARGRRQEIGKALREERHMNAE